MRTTRRWGGAALLAATLLLAAACRKTNDAQQDAAGAGDAAMNAALPPGHVPVPSVTATGLEPLTQALLDSGNAAFRQKDFAAALAFYGKARDVQPEHVAPWFGTYMVAEATKNTALADSALRMVRERAPEMQQHPVAPPIPGELPASPGAPPSHYSPHKALPRDKSAPATAPRS